jgi:hypothetical protein
LKVTERDCSQRRVTLSKSVPSTEKRGGTTGEFSTLAEAAGDPANFPGRGLAMRLSTYKPSRGRGISTGGIFGSFDGVPFLPWSPAAQAALLIEAWRLFYQAVESCDLEWANHLRRVDPSPDGLDPAFFGPHSLVDTSRGVRACLLCLNDVLASAAGRLGLADLPFGGDERANDQAAVADALRLLRAQPGPIAILREVALSLAGFDWRSPRTRGLSAEVRRVQETFSGDKGYKALQLRVLQCLAENPHLSADANEALDARGDDAPAEAQAGSAMRPI